MWKFGIGALVVAAVLGFMTYTEGTLAFQSSAEPELISLKNLIARGADGNANLIVDKFVLCKNLANQYKSNSPNVWTHVWIPIVPIDEVDPSQKEPPSPKKVKALFFSLNIRNEPELEAKLNRPTVQGLVTNRITSLDSKIRNILQQNYPETDFNTCLIIQEGRTPFSRNVVYMMGAGTVLALLVGLGLFLAAWLGKRQGEMG